MKAIKPGDAEPGKYYTLEGNDGWLYRAVKDAKGDVRLLRQVDGEDSYYVMRDHRAVFILAKDQPKQAALPYKYNEPALLEDLRVYVDDTYGEHYAQTSFQSTEVIIDSGYGVGFCLGNVLKYANRYGRKEGRNRKDLFKILHYTLIAIFIHDKEVT